MKLRVLGASGGVGPGLRTTSLLIDQDILIDVGSGVGDLTLDEMAALRHVFITHSHLDHIAFLPLLLDSIFERLDAPLQVHAQPATLQALREHIFNWKIWPDFSVLPHPQSPVVTLVEMTPERVVTVEERTLEMIPVNHTVPGVGFRIACPSGALAFSGDTTTNDSLWDALNAHDRLDILIVEAAFGDHNRALSQLARHYCPSLLAQDLVKLKHDPLICITHNKPGDEAVIFAECERVIAGRKLHRLHGGEVFVL